jgi:hypothetical protein
MGYTPEQMSERSKKTHQKHPELASRMGKNSAERNKKEKSKSVVCFETNIVYPSISEASRQTEIDPGSISRSCYNNHRAAGGFHWNFAGESK